MRYEWMFPDEIRRAIDLRTPVAMVLGIIEYHADHCCVGTDLLLPQRALERLEKEFELVLLPPVPYCAASYAVAAPERNGTIHVGADALLGYGRDLFTSLLRIGFRNVHCFYAHQSENYLQGMPTDLAFKLAAREAIFAFLEKERGEGWWGDEKSVDYYEKHRGGENPFNWIQIHPYKLPCLQRKHPGDHAGISETSLMEVLCPEGVRPSAPKKHWFTKSAENASPEYGERVLADILAELRKLLNPGK